MSTSSWVNKETVTVTLGSSDSYSGVTSNDSNEQYLPKAKK